MVEDKLVIDIQNLTMHPPGRNSPILLDLTMQIKKGSVAAMMGGSGCGKTTFMLYLTRRMREPEKNWGTIAKRSAFPKRVAFVAQKDMFFPFDTPERHLMFAHQRAFACPMEVTMAAVDRVLELVNLTDPVKRRTLIGEGSRESTMSGGERRLLSIATQLIVDPEVVILDEPTTGIDSYTALMLIKQLKDIAAKSGTTFVVSIHQPSKQLLAEFDIIKHLTPPQWKPGTAPITQDQLISVGSELPQENEGCDEEEALSKVEGARPGGLLRWLVLLLLFTKRAMIRSFVNYRAAPLRLVASFFVAIAAGVAFAQLEMEKGSAVRDILGMGMAFTAVSFVPIIFGATLFPLEQDMMVEEHVHLEDPLLLADVIARWVVDMFIGVIAAAVFTIAAPIVNVTEVGYFFLTLAFQAWASDSFGFVLSTVARPHVAIGVIIPTIGFLSIALGTGVIQPMKEDEGWIFHSLKWVSFFKYGFSSLVLNQLPTAVEPCMTCPYPTGSIALEALHLSGDEYHKTTGFQYLMLFSFSMVLRILSFFTLRVLIVHGNRRYHYNSASAGPAAPVVYTTPAETNTQSTPSIEAKQEQEMSPTPEVEHSPAEADSSDDEHSIDAHDLAERRPVEVTAHHKWTMDKVVVEPSALSHALQCRAMPEVPPTVLDVPELVLKPRQLVAVIGPTGSGKSTLLQALCGRTTPGISNPNTKLVSTQDDASILLVDGNDEFFHNVDVIDPVLFHARMHHAHLSEKEVYDLSAKQLTLLGLLPEKHHNAAYTLSGGQMRRLSVACKMVMNPAILCLDEPTSGLDTGAARNMISLLANLARVEDVPVSILCSVQQPEEELVNMFDRFIFMKEGKIEIDGTEQQCRKHFGIENDEDTYGGDWVDVAICLIQDNEPDNLRALMAERSHQFGATFSEGDEEGSTTKKPRHVGISTICFDQPVDFENAVTRDADLRHTPHTGTIAGAIELARRSAKVRWQREPGVTLATFLVRYLLLPVSFGIVMLRIGDDDPTFMNRAGALFMYAAGLSFTSMVTAAVTYPLHMRILEEEMTCNLFSPVSYLLSQWFGTMLLEDVIGCVLGSVAIKYFTSLNVDFGILLGASIITSQSMDSLGYLCGLFRSLSVSSGLTTLIIVPMFLGGGILVTTAQIERVPIMRLLEGISLLRNCFLETFYSELVESTPYYEMVYSSFGFNNPEKWYSMETVWGTAIGWMVFLRLVTLIAYPLVLRSKL